MRYTSILVILFFVIFGCKPRTRFDNTPPENGVFKTKKEMPRVGMMDVEETYRNGKVIQEVGFFKNHTKAYERYFFSEQNKESTRAYYRSGKLRSTMLLYNNGAEYSAVEYYENGQLKWKGNNNTPQEETYYENGQLQSKIVWENGEVVKKTLWYENGKKKEESHWRHDRLNGYTTTWDSTGKMLLSQLYKNGISIHEK